MSTETWSKHEKIPQICIELQCIMLDEMLPRKSEKRRAIKKTYINAAAS